MKKLIAILLVSLFVAPALAMAAVTFPVNGGTGSTTLNGIIMGNGTSPVNTVTIGANLNLTGTTLSATGGSGGTGAATSSFFATFPLVLTTSTSAITFSFAGLATTSPWTIGQVAVVSDSNHVTSVATGTVSGGTAISVTAGQSIIGSGLTITNTGVTSLSATAPLVNNLSTGAISLTCNVASAIQPGCLSALDFSKFNSATTTFTSPLVYTVGTNAVTCPTCGASSTILTDNNTWTGLNMFLASTTIGNGTQKGGLTVSGGATTTGYLVVQGSATSTFTGAISATYLNLTGASATSTFARGIDLAGGCFSIAGTCVGSGSGVSGGTNGMLTAWTGATTLTATSGPTAQFFYATSSNATSTFLGAIEIGPHSANCTGENKLCIVAPSTWNDYFGLLVQNQSNGTVASSDIVAANDNTDPNAYVDMGANSTLNTNSSFTLIQKGDAYLFSNTGLGNLVIANGSSTKAIIFGSGGFLTANEAGRFNGSGLFTLGTTTPFWKLTIASSTGPQIGLTDTTAGSFAWTFRSVGNNFFLATSTATATSSASALAINANGLANFTSSLAVASSTPWSRLTVGAGGAITTTEASSTAAANVTIDWRNGNQQKLIMNANTTIHFGFNQIPGQTLRLIVCSDASARTLTWGTSSSTIIWAGHVQPTQTATAKVCDHYQFDVTGATSTSGSVTFGSATQNF